MAEDYRQQHLNLVDRYLMLRIEEKYPVYRQIYSRWVIEARLLAAHGNGHLVDGNYGVRTTLEDFVDSVNMARNIKPVSIRTIQRDLQLIRLHAGIPGLERYLFTQR